MKPRISALVGFLLEAARVRAFVRAAGSLAIACSLASFSCLSPQDIEVEVPPVKAHLPPTFDVTKDVTPNTPLVCVSSLDPQATEFRIDNVQDASGQPLSARWFIDYDGGFTAIQETADLTPKAGDTLYQAAVFSSNLIDSVHQNGRPFFLDVVISDGFADPPAEPINRAIAPGAFSITYRWSVEYLEGTPCPESP